ncbi:hypothetical protein N0V88_006569 [Collariella sp. IMI 366227]|nr:hypothetical protein N0V88_006569 [Collariella sp. IMI 366227]
MSANPNSVGNQGEFHDRVPPSHPSMKSRHQLGPNVQHSAHPEFHAETYPAGTAPPEHSFQPNATEHIPGQALNPDADEYGHTGPLDMPGATSRDVYNASTFARPMEGQTHRELHGPHAGKHKKERSGLEGVGATVSEETVEGGGLAEGVEKGLGEGNQSRGEGADEGGGGGE